MSRKDLNYEEIVDLVHQHRRIDIALRLMELWQFHTDLVDEAVGALHASEDILEAAFDRFGASLETLAFEMPVELVCLDSFPDALSRYFQGNSSAFCRWFWVRWNTPHLQPWLRSQIALRALNHLVEELLRRDEFSFDDIELMRQEFAHRQPGTRTTWLCTIFNQLQEAAFEVYVVEALVSDIAAV